MNIELHIEALVLHGFALADRQHIAAAVERELVRLLSEQGLPSGLAAGSDRPHVDGGSFTIAPNAQHDQIGMQMAQAVYGGMRHE